MVVIKKEQYNKIISFIKTYPGLAMECEKELVQMFPEVGRYPLGSILSKHGQMKQKNMHHRLSQRVPEFLDE